MTGAARWRGLLRVSSRAVSLVAGLAGELSDERAYRRHLAAHGRDHSADEWRRFSDARLKRKFAQGRCC